MILKDGFYNRLFLWFSVNYTIFSFVKSLQSEGLKYLLKYVTIVVGSP